jgi:hypothetical protein
VDFSAGATGKPPKNLSGGILFKMSPPGGCVEGGQETPEA